MRLFASFIIMTLLLNPSYQVEAQTTKPTKKFEVVEATITQIQDAIKSKQITSTDLVKMYLARIKAYNGVCVN